MPEVTSFVGVNGHFARHVGCRGQSDFLAEPRPVPHASDGLSQTLTQRLEFCARLPCRLADKHRLNRAPIGRPQHWQRRLRNSFGWCPHNVRNRRKTISHSCSGSCSVVGRYQITVIRSRLNTGRSRHPSPSTSPRSNARPSVSCTRRASRCFLPPCPRANLRRERNGSRSI